MLRYIITSVLKVDFFFLKKAKKMIIILSFNAAFVAWGPKNKHTQRHTCTQRKKKFFSPLGKQ